MGLSFCKSAAIANLQVMIELRTPYGSFDLGPDFKLSIVDENNALDWNASIKLERVYPTTLPWTPNNAQIWMHADRLESQTKRLKVQCDLIVDGHTEFRGLCNLLQTIEGKSYTVNVTYNNEVINPDMLLTEIPYTEVLSEFSTMEGYHLWNTNVTDMITGNALTQKFACPIVRQEHFTYNFLNHWALSTQEYRDGNIVPMFYVRYVLQMIAKSWGLKLIGGFNTDSELLKLLIFNTYNYSAGQFIPGPIYFMTSQELEMKNHMPKVSVKELIAALKLRFACGMHIDSSKMTLNLFSLRDIMTGAKKVDVTPYIKGIGYKEITPDNGGYTFEQTQDSEDTYTEFIENDVPLNYRGTVPNMFTLLFTIISPNTSDVYLVTENDYYWKFNGTAWQQWKYRYHTYKTGENRLTDTSGAVMCNMNWDPLNGEDWKTMICQYPKEDVENNLVQPTLRFAIYQGMQETQNTTDLYPFGSIDHLDSKGATIGELDLRDDGEFGQYARYKLWRAQMSTNREKSTIYLKECNSILAKLTPDTRAMVHNQEYMWERKTRTYDIRGLVDVELECVKI